MLSGGGARGFAHIGVLRALERCDVEPDVIVGTSMGAVLGALYAAGHSAEDLYELGRTTSWRDVIDVSLQAGLLKGVKLQAFLRERLPETFAELDKPLAITTTDIETGEEIVLLEGDLVRAIRASSSFPGAFEPIRVMGRTLADGGIVNNLPVEAAAFLHATFVIASDATPPRRSVYRGLEEQGGWWERTMATVRLERRNPMVQMLLRSTDIMQSLLTDIQYTLHPADVLVKLAMPEVRMEQFWDFERIVELGEREAEEAFRSAGLLDGDATAVIEGRAALRVMPSRRSSR